MDVEPDTVDESIRYILRSPEMRSLYLSQKNISAELVEKICQHPDRFGIRHLNIMASAKNIHLLAGFSWLEKVNIGESDVDFDFSGFNKLWCVGGVWSPSWKGLEQCQALRVFRASKFRGDFASIPNLKNLNEVSLIQPSITKLDGLDSARHLSVLELLLANKLESIDALGSCAESLVRLEIDGCKKIKSYASLAELLNLRELFVVSSADLPTISFIEKMPALTTLSVFETKILDHDLSYCLLHPTLKDFRSENKRSYIPSVPDVERKLAASRVAGPG